MALMSLNFLVPVSSVSWPGLGEGLPWFPLCLQASMLELGLVEGITYLAFKWSHF